MKSADAIISERAKALIYTDREAALNDRIVSLERKLAAALTDLESLKAERDQWRKVAKEYESKVNRIGSLDAELIPTGLRGRAS